MRRDVCKINLCLLGIRSEWVSCLKLGIVIFCKRPVAFTDSTARFGIKTVGRPVARGVKFQILQPSASSGEDGPRTISAAQLRRRRNTFLKFMATTKEKDSDDYIVDESGVECARCDNVDEDDTAEELIEHFELAFDAPTERFWTRCLQG